MVSTNAILAERFFDFTIQYGARKVDSGANLILQISDDQIYFSNRLGDTLQTTSPLQTNPDLRAMDGRWEEATKAFYEKYFRKKLMEAYLTVAENHEGI